MKDSDKYPRPVRCVEDYRILNHSNCTEEDMDIDNIGGELTSADAWSQNNLSVTSRDDARRSLAADVESYLNQGGKIEVIS